MNGFFCVTGTSFQKIILYKPERSGMEFLRLVLLSEAGATSFSDLSWYNGTQYLIIRETGCLMDLLVDDPE